MREQMEKDKARPRKIPADYETHLQTIHAVVLVYELLDEGLTRHLSSIDTGVTVLCLLKTGPKARVKKGIDNFYRQQKE